MLSKSDIKILIVEDQEMDQEILKKIFKHKCTIRSAANGVEALEILNKEKIDVVLTDIVMPKMDGLELLQQIRANYRWNQVGVLVATSHKERTERKALELGADDIISKPYDAVVLRRRIENISAKKNVEQALKIAEEANKAKTEFLSAMSHDIRTPMNAIIGMTELALADMENKEQVRESLNVINNSSHHLLQLINDILDMSRIESGRMKIIKSNFRHSKEIREFVEQTTVLARNKNIRFKHSILIDHDCCIGDAERIHRILDNIVGNAVKFTQEGGMVSFEVEELPSRNARFVHYQYVITDTGIGMDEQTLKKIFEPFYRSDSVSEDKIEGTGLGMSIVRNAVELAGGTIAIKSTLGKGTKVCVDLPFEIDENKHIEKNETDFTEYDLTGKKVLLIEDHLVNQKVAARILEKEGMIVTIANNGREGLEKVKENGADKFDVILMDIQMPVMDGFEATRQIRALPDAMAKKIPILAMTANAFGKDVKHCMDVGMNEHISKPIDPKRLYRVIGKYTDSLLKENSKSWRQSILIVDDVEINRAVLETALGEKFKILHAEDGVSALKQMKNHSDIAAVITDIQMPNMNGLELIQRIRKNRQYDHIAILANTQYGDVTQEEVLLKAGADDFLYKPTTPTIVATRLKNVLKNYFY